MNLIPSHRIKKPQLNRILLILQAFSLAYSAAAMAVGETVSIGSKTGDQHAYASTTSSSMSADGRYTALTATNSYIQGIFLYDRYAGTSKFLNIPGIAPEISANASYIAFRSSDISLVGNDANGFVSDIFFHDVQSGKNELISKASDGTQANDQSYFAAISNDGQTIAFSSDANNLVANDTNNVSDIFLHQRKTGKTTRISVSSAGKQADMGIGNGMVDISGDSRFVVFTSFASNLVASSGGGGEDIFLRDTKLGITTQISQPIKQTGWSGDSKHPAISNDGRFIVFYSGSSQLIADDTDDFNSDIFVYDRLSKKNTKITKNADGNSIMPTISATGRYVAFISQASNLVADDTNGTWDTFVHDRQTGKTSRLNVTPLNLQSTGDSMLLMTRPSISADGRFISFESGAKDLTADDTDSAYTDVFLRDMSLNKQKSADVSLTLSGSTAAVKDQQLIYTFNVANQGPAAANQANVIINLPGTLAVIAVIPSQGSCIPAAITTCRLGILNSGVKKQIQVKVKALEQGVVKISGSAESLEKDNAYSNNSAAITVTVN